jgi:hypothetical protein
MNARFKIRHDPATGEPISVDWDQGEYSGSIIAGDAKGEGYRVRIHPGYEFAVRWNPAVNMVIAHQSLPSAIGKNDTIASGGDHVLHQRHCWNGVPSIPQRGSQAAHARAVQMGRKAARKTQISQRFSALFSACPLLLSEHDWD